MPTTNIIAETRFAEMIRRGERLTEEETALIEAIAERAMGMKIYPDSPGGEFECFMDIETVHTMCCGLRLRELLDADKFNFIHDLAGIRSHLDRNEIALRNYFLPRFALTEAEFAGRWENEEKNQEAAK